jgi:hypothetical protein
MVIWRGILPEGVQTFWREKKHLGVLPHGIRKVF